MNKKKPVRKRAGSIAFGEARKAAAGIAGKAKQSPRYKRALTVAQKAENEIGAIVDGADTAMRDGISAWPDEAKRLLASLDDNPHAFWGEADTDQLTVMLSAMRGKKGAPKKDSTRQRIQLAAKLTAGELSIYKQAPLLFPSKPNTTAYLAARAFHSRYRQEIAILCSSNKKNPATP